MATVLTDFGFMSLKDKETLDTISENYLDRNTAINTYITKNSANNTYLTKTAASNIYATQQALSDSQITTVTNDDGITIMKGSQTLLKIPVMK